MVSVHNSASEIHVSYTHSCLLWFPFCCNSAGCSSTCISCPEASDTRTTADPDSSLGDPDSNLFMDIDFEEDVPDGVDSDALYLRLPLIHRPLTPAPAGTCSHIVCLSFMLLLLPHAPLVNIIFGACRV